MAQAIKLSEDYRDCLQEVSNVAMGRAADLLARLLDVYVILPIPNVNLIEISELHMALSSLEDTQSISAVCQGFIGSNISGEALLIFNDTSFSDIAELTHFKGLIDKNIELELLMDIANILIGACLQGVSEQLDVKFSQGQPVVLGQHIKVPELIDSAKKRWKQTLAIEINYTIENRNINCDLLLLFTEDSLSVLNDKIDYLME